MTYAATQYNNGRDLASAINAIPDGTTLVWVYREGHEFWLVTSK